MLLMYDPCKQSIHTLYQSYPEGVSRVYHSVHPQSLFQLKNDVLPLRIVNPLNSLINLVVTGNKSHAVLTYICTLAVTDAKLECDHPNQQTIFNIILFPNGFVLGVWLPFLFKSEVFEMIFNS